MRAYNGLNSIKVNIIEAGICPVCGRLLSIEKCDHATTLEIEQWRAAVFAAEQELHSELWQRERLTDSAQRDADLLNAEIEKNGWYEIPDGTEPSPIISGGEVLYPSYLKTNDEMPF